MTAAAPTHPEPGSRAPGAPPRLRRQGPDAEDRHDSSPPGPAAAAPAGVGALPARADLAGARLVAALVGAATGLWLERRWRR